MNCALHFKEAHTLLVDFHFNYHRSCHLHFSLLKTLMFIVLIIFCNLRMQIEARDPASGALYFYNESTMKSQWDRPTEAPALVSGVCSVLPEYWQEVFDESTGMLCITTLLVVYLLQVISLFVDGERLD